MEYQQAQNYEGLSQSVWNPQGYGNLMEQTGPGYSDEMEIEKNKNIDINFDIPSDQRKEYTNKSWRPKRDWASYARKKAASAREVSKRFFDSLDLSNTTDIQDDILLYSIQYGTTEAGCTDGDDLVAGYEWPDITMLEEIEADEGWEEEVLVEVMINGLMGRGGGGFISTPSRRWNKKDLYKHLEKILDEHDQAVDEGTSSEFERLTDGIINLWLEKIDENNQLDEPKGSQFVCYNGNKENIDNVFYDQYNEFGEEIRKKYINEYGKPVGDSFSFSELADQYSEEADWQAVIDDWDGKSAEGRTKRIWSQKERQQMGGYRRRRLTIKK